MACNPAVPPVPGKTSTEMFDDAHFRVYQMFHLCTFVADLAGQIDARQVDELHGESIQVVFGLIADQLHAANEEFLASVQKERA